MLAIELPPDVEKRLEQAVLSVGRSKSELVAQALLAHLDDLEDVAAAEAAQADILSGRSGTTSLDDVERDLGLAD